MIAVNVSTCFSQVSFTRHVIDDNLRNAFTVFAEDVDGNGAIDIIAGGQGQQLALYKNNGSASFAKISISNSFGNVWSVHAYDVNRDGAIDILGASYSLNQVAWWENRGGSFTKHVIDNNFTGAEAVRAADMDGDGHVDIVAVAVKVDQLVWYKNNGNQSFSKIIISDNLFRPHYLCIADLDGDGHNDIAVAAADERAITWWKNNGNGNFSVRTVSRNFVGAYCVEAVDLDQDGDLDLIGAAHATNQIAWWSNNGSGNFTKHVVDNNFTGTHSVFAGDIDNDGNIDLVATARYLNEVAWYENNGNQSFTKRSIDNNVIEPQVVMLADLDNDGDLDVISVSRLNHTVYWWENQSTPESISTPNRPDGAQVGIVGESYLYTTGGSSSNLGHTVEYQFDFGDGNYSNWGNSQATHAYLISGEFNVRARARCSIHTSRISSWSSALLVRIEEENITTPSRPQGPVSGREAEVLSFSTGGAVSNYGHDIQYQFDWGDGKTSAWGDSSRNYSYSSVGDFQVRSRARCQLHTNIVSSWSEALNISILPIEYRVAGSVSYYDNQQPVPDVSIQLTGDVTGFATTNADGEYQKMVSAESDINLAPFKTKNQHVGAFDITTYDAALTARYALKLGNLNQYQMLAADADKSGDILTYDAALIARYAVGLTPGSNSCVGEWLFVPSVHQIQNISSDHLSEDFIAVLIGNVHGGWSVQENLYSLKTNDFFNAASIKKRQLNEQVEFLFFNSGEKNTIAVYIDLMFNPKVVQYVGVYKTHLTEQFELIENVESGRVRIGAYSVNVVDEPDVLFRVSFRHGKDSGEATFEIQKYMLNGETVFSGITQVEQNMKEITVTDYLLGQNYPDPFNSTTVIPFQTPESGRARVQIYNLSGQLVSTLFDQEVNSGNYLVMWDGSNSRGEIVTAGVYIYRLQINNFIDTNKLLFLK